MTPVPKRSPPTTVVHEKEEGKERRRKKRELTAQQIHRRRGGGGGEWDSVVGVLCQECRHMLELEVLKGLFLSFHSTGTVQTPLWQTAHRRRHAQPLSGYQCAFLCLGALVFTHVSEQEAAPPTWTSSQASLCKWFKCALVFGGGDHIEYASRT